MFVFPDCVVIDDSAYFHRVCGNLALVGHEQDSSIFSFVSSIIFAMSFSCEAFETLLENTIESNPMVIELGDKARVEFRAYARSLFTDLTQLNLFTTDTDMPSLPFCYRGRYDGKLVLEKFHRSSI